MFCFLCNFVNVTIRHLCQVLGFVSISFIMLYLYCCYRPIGFSCPIICTFHVYLTPGHNKKVRKQPKPSKPDIYDIFLCFTYCCRDYSGWLVTFLELKDRHDVSFLILSCLLFCTKYKMNQPFLVIIIFFNA